VGSGVVEKDTKTHQGRRLMIDAGTVEVLRGHRRAWETYAELAGTRITQDSYLFSSVLDASTPWRPDVATNRFIRLCKDLNITGVRLHDLRHYVATSLGAAGTPIATISSRLGHRDRATTLNVYSHSLPALDHQAAEVIGALIDDPAAADV
jgi:integrase